MKKLVLFLITLFLNLTLLSQELMLDASKKPLKETRIKLFSPGVSLVTAKMLFYEDYSTLFFINAESEQVEREFYRFTLSNQDMDKVYQLLIKNDATSEDVYRMETLEEDCYILIDYKIIGKKSYAKLRLYEDKNDLTGVRLTKMPRKKLIKLFNKKKRTKKKRNKE